MSIWFREDYYLKTKLALMSDAEKTEKQISTPSELKDYMAKVGMTPEEHYALYGRSEGLNPNPYFNENEYLQAKLEQLHSINERDAAGQPYTLETLKEAIAAIGLTPAEHYEVYGAHETKADGTLINPSNAFDANAYAPAKLYQLQHSPDAATAAQWADKTPADVMEAIVAAGMSPVSHYMIYGADEANVGKVAMVQTVPSEQRVENDPLRDQLGENVPSNYNPPSEGPEDAKAAPVDKAADMGDLADHKVSPQVTPPSEPVKVPSDKGYVAPPANITDTNENPVIPPSTSGTGQVSDKWLVVNPSQDSAVVLDKDGTILGEVGVSTAGGTVTLPPSEASKPADKLPAVDPDDLPPNVQPGHPDDNLVTSPDTPDTPVGPTPPTPTKPVAPTFDDKIAGDDIIDMGEAHSGVKFTGKTTANSDVTIIIKDADESTVDVTLTGKADSEGKFTITDKKGELLKLTDGDLTITATAKNTAGESEAATREVTLHAHADVTYSATEGEGVETFGYTAPKPLEKATLGSLDPSGTGLLDELQKVYNTEANSINLDYLKNNAQSISKLVHFSENKEISTTDVLGNKNASHYNLKIDGVYGGGVALTVDDLKASIEASRMASLATVIGKAYFDVPTITATAKDVVNLEVDKVGSIHNGALTADILNDDLTFSSLVKLFSEMKPIAVDVQAPKLDIHLGDDKNVDIVNLMEVRGTVNEITFSGTKGLFGLNIDARSDEHSATSGRVQHIDASSLTDPSSGVYVNTAPIGISLGEINKGVNATVADNLTFTGSRGDDILVMTQDKYGKAGVLDGGANDNAGDTLAILVDATPGQSTTITANGKMTGFENVAFVSFAMTQDEETGGYTFSQFSADASSFAAKGVKNFITSNDLTLDNYGGETVTVVGGLDGEVKINLKESSTTSATINLAMTSNFLNTALSEDGLIEGKAILTNADKINELILKGADANADILLTDDALQDLDGGTIDVSGYAGDIQLANGWTYDNFTITKDNYKITVSGTVDIIAADQSA